MLAVPRRSHIAIGEPTAYEHCIGDSICAAFVIGAREALTAHGKNDCSGRFRV
jgi:hypothetical protein